MKGMNLSKVFEACEQARRDVCGGKRRCDPVMWISSKLSEAV
jgi:hypothetical protein